MRQAPAKNGGENRTVLPHLRDQAVERSSKLSSNGGSRFDTPLAMGAA
jgi:hypothetical protein